MNRGELQAGIYRYFGLLTGKGEAGRLRSDQVKTVVYLELFRAGDIEKMKYSDDTDERRKANIDYVNQRWTQLYGWEKETGTEGIKYLFLVNSGAAVAVLAFHGSVEAVRAMVWPKVMLGLFVLGLILIGFLHFFRYFSAYRLFANWRGLAIEYFTDSKDWNTTVAEDIKKSERFRWIDWIAYASFACFIAGAGVGMLNFSSLNGGSNVRKEAVTAPAKTDSTGKASDPTSGKTH